jgi:fumarate reductase subunit C
MCADDEVVGTEALQPKSARATPRTDEEWANPETYLDFGQYGETLETRSPDLAVEAGWPTVRTKTSRIDAWLELSLAVSGVALVGFMIMHLGLLLSSMLGADTMDRLAAFLEGYYLLQSAAPLLVLVLVAHAVLALRKAPSTARAQVTLFKHMRTLRHLDTWMWAVQLVTGAALVLLAAIHLWVILTDLPIQAAKSGARIYGIYIWFYVPFLLLVEAHAAAGIYRIVVKWSSISRVWAHVALTLWMVVFLGLGFAVLAALYGTGAQS